MTLTPSDRSLFDALRQRILILDGAMATMLLARGMTDPDCVSVLRAPSVVADIHRGYIAAGADIIRTATFSAGSCALSSPDPAGFLGSVIPAACRLAREEASGCSRRIFIAGSLGPVSPRIHLSDGRKPSLRDIEDIFATQYAAFEAAGADLLAVETAYEPDSTEAALKGLSRGADISPRRLPVMLSMTPVGDSETVRRERIAAIADLALRYDLPVIGLNCGSGPADLARYLDLLSPLPAAVAFFPGCGLPDSEGSYSLTPEQFADTVRSAMSRGKVNIAGGCCGTTPAHVAALARMSAQFPPRQFSTSHL